MKLALSSLIALLLLASPALADAAARSRALNVGLPYYRTLPTPDSTISAADRAHLGHLYFAGVAPAASSITPTRRLRNAQ